MSLTDFAVGVLTLGLFKKQAKSGIDVGVYAVDESVKVINRLGDEPKSTESQPANNKPANNVEQG